MKEFELSDFHVCTEEELSKISGGGDFFGPIFQVLGYIGGYADQRSSSHLTNYAPITWPGLQHKGYTHY